MSLPYTLKGTPTHAPDHGAWVGTGFRLVLAVVLLTAGGLKVTDLGQSAVAVKAYRLFPQPIQAEIIGYALPPLEIVIGILLLLGLFTRAAATVTAVLMVVFIIGIASVWIRDISIECGCFNSGGALTSPVNQYEYAREIFRDSVLLVMSGWLIIWPRTRFALDTIARPHLHKVYDLMLDDEDDDDIEAHIDDDIDVAHDLHASTDPARITKESPR